LNPKVVPVRAHSPCEAFLTILQKDSAGPASLAGECVLALIAVRDAVVAVATGLCKLARGASIDAGVVIEEEAIEALCAPS
jgi:hypothetical protein